MDPLTHTLVGANLAATRLGTKTRLAVAALVVGANLPDVDSILYFTGQQDLALGFRRGWTHGVLALLVLPFVLTAILLWYARLRPDPRRPVDRRWLFALSTLGILTHPVLDWLNNYGMRWLMPFRGTWFYGDSVYIMDPWLWLILGGAWLAGRKPTVRMIVAFSVLSGLLGWIVGQRAPMYLAVVGIVALVLLAALLSRPGHSFSAAALAIAFAYIAGRLVIHELTVSAIRHELPEARDVMAAPQPIDPMRWDVVARTDNGYRVGRYTWSDRRLTLSADRLPLPRRSPEWDAARRDPSIRGFMTWVRFPWYEIERLPTGTRVLIHDARYAVRRRQAGGFGGVVVMLPAGR